ncbi:MAG: NAD(+)/NADH kinase [Spirochaetaceae bacterium]|jgi:NAD+ kinase|nr:NAD(+)/NADH kinase [Spirochaetaceae bacterium]
MSDVKRALLFVNSHKADAQVLADEIQGELGCLGIEWVVYPFADAPAFSVGDGFDIALSLGGDGTVLYTARIVSPLGIPILPINIGTLGFIAAVRPDEWAGVFQKWLAGTACLSRRLMLDLAVERRGKIAFRAVCLNDVVVSSSGIAKIVRLNVSADTGGAGDGNGGGLLRLGHYQSDGLIVATPTGSTAYSVAAGGPIVDPEIEAVIINPICPFTLSNRPIVVPAHETVIVEVKAEQRSGVLLTVDGQTSELLEPSDRILIRSASCRTHLIASGRGAFYAALRTKLNWFGAPGEYPRNFRNMSQESGHA